MIILPVRFLVSFATSQILHLYGRNLLILFLLNFEIPKNDARREAKLKSLIEQCFFDKKILIVRCET